MRIEFEDQPTESALQLDCKKKVGERCEHTSFHYSSSHERLGDSVVHEAKLVADSCNCRFRLRDRRSETPVFAMDMDMSLPWPLIVFLVLFFTLFIATGAYICYFNFRLHRAALNAMDTVDYSQRTVVIDGCQVRTSTVTTFASRDGPPPAYNDVSQSAVLKV